MCIVPYVVVKKCGYFVKSVLVHARFYDTIGCVKLLFVYRINGVPYRNDISERIIY